MEKEEYKKNSYYYDNDYIPKKRLESSKKTYSLRKRKCEQAPTSIYECSYKGCHMKSTVCFKIIRHIYKDHIYAKYHE